MNGRVYVALCLAAIGVACTTAAGPGSDSNGPEYFSMPATRALNLPFSDAVQVGELLFLSGQLGNLPGEPRLAPGGVTAETRQAMENIRAVLAQHGLGMDNLVKCTVFLADMAEWRDFNAVYVEYFTGPLPARSALGVNELALGASVEVECVAHARAAGAERR